MWVRSTMPLPRQNSLKARHRNEYLSSFHISRRPRFLRGAVRIPCDTDPAGSVRHFGAPQKSDRSRRAGTLHYKVPDKPEQIAAVSAGLIKVENNEVLILVDSAERPEDIDVNRARRAADEAKEAMLQKKSIQEYRSAQTRLARAISRLRVKSNYMEGKQ